MQTNTQSTEGEELQQTTGAACSVLPIEGLETELRIFKRQTKGFIKWVCDSDEQTKGGHKEDCRAVTKSATFEDVSKILAGYDYDGTFMYMVRCGYF